MTRWDGGGGGGGLTWHLLGLSRAESTLTVIFKTMHMFMLFRVEMNICTGSFSI